MTGKPDRLGSFPTSTCVMSGIRMHVFFKSRAWQAATRKFYFKALRRSNRANAEGVGSAATLPVRTAGFRKFSKLEKRRPPNATCLAAEVVENQALRPVIRNVSHACKPFLFSYYCYGISFIDMAMLTAAHISQMEDGDHIVSLSGRRSSGRKGVKPYFRLRSRLRDPATDREPAKAGSPTVDDFLAADRHLPAIRRAALLCTFSEPVTASTRNTWCPLAEELPELISLPDESHCPRYGGL